MLALSSFTYFCADVCFHLLLRHSLLSSSSQLGSTVLDPVSSLTILTASFHAAHTLIVRQYAPKVQRHSPAVSSRCSKARCTLPSLCCPHCRFSTGLRLHCIVRAAAIAAAQTFHEQKPHTDSFSLFSHATATTTVYTINQSYSFIDDTPQL